MRKARVWYEDEIVGFLEETDEGYRFTYTDKYLSKTSAQAVSLTMPLRVESYNSKTLFPFFDGLIPEGWLLELGTHNWKLDPKDRFGLLLAFCRDSIGAVGVELEDMFLTEKDASNA